MTRRALSARPYRVGRCTHPPTPCLLLAVERRLNAQWRWYTWLCPENAEMQGLTIIHCSASGVWHMLRNKLNGFSRFQRQELLRLR